MKFPIWSATRAKAKFGEMIDCTMTQGPQTITRNGRIVAMVIGEKEPPQKTKRVGTLVDFFANSPLRESGLKLPRRSRSRTVNF